jgi:Probable cobalt transporter subunit (CbtB)
VGYQRNTLTTRLRDDTVQRFAEELEVRWESGTVAPLCELDKLHCLRNCTAKLESDPSSDELRQRGSQEPEGGLMSEATHAEPVAAAAPPFTFAQVLPWLIFAATLFLVAWYFVSAEQGAASLFSGSGVHEWVHDGRHLLGFPCH